MAELNAEFKRRALYTVMSSVVSGNTLMEVLWVWEKKYSSRSQYELNGFFSEFKGVPAIAKHRATLYRELISLLMKQSSDLLPDPLPKMQAYREEVGETSVATLNDQEDWAEVWMLVVDPLVAGLDGSQIGNVRSAVEERMLTKISDADLRYDVAARLTGKNTKSVKPISYTTARTLLNLVYVGLCEVLGPSVADRMLGTAIRKAETQSKGLNPKSLLDFND